MENALFDEESKHFLDPESLEKATHCNMLYKKLSGAFFNRLSILVSNFSVESDQKAILEALTQTLSRLLSQAGQQENAPLIHDFKLALHEQIQRNNPYAGRALGSMIKAFFLEDALKTLFEIQEQRLQIRQAGQILAHSENALKNPDLSTEAREKLEHQRDIAQSILPETLNYLAVESNLAQKLLKIQENEMAFRRKQKATPDEAASGWQPQNASKRADTSQQASIAETKPAKLRRG